MVDWHPFNDDGETVREELILIEYCPATRQHEVRVPCRELAKLDCGYAVDYTTQFRGSLRECVDYFLQQSEVGFRLACAKPNDQDNRRREAASGS